MKKHRLTRWTVTLGGSAAAIILGASIAIAGTYVSGPLPSEFSGGFVPPSPDTLKGIDKAAKQGSKLAGKASKCYTKGAKNVSKGKPSGVDECINNTKKGVLAKYEAGIAKVASKFPLPPCHDFVADGAVIKNLTKLFNPQIYCQSPSGAFLDQVTM